MPVYNYFLLNRNFMFFFPFIKYVVIYKMLCFFWRFCVIISFFGTDTSFYIVFDQVIVWDDVIFQITQQV